MAGLLQWCQLVYLGRVWGYKYHHSQISALMVVEFSYLSSIFPLSLCFCFSLFLSVSLFLSLPLSTSLDVAELQMSKSRNCNCNISSGRGFKVSDCHFYCILLVKARQRLIQIQVSGNTVNLLMGVVAITCVQGMLDTGRHNSLRAIFHGVPHMGRTNC